MSLLALLVAIIFMQVVMRYVFHSSLSWSEEFGRYAFIWLTWLSTGYAVHHKRHLRIEVLPDFFQKRGKLIIDIFAMTVWCAFGLFLVNYGFKIATMLWARGQLTAALEIPMAVCYAAVPTGALLMSIRLILAIRASFKELANLKKEGV